MRQYVSFLLLNIQSLNPSAGSTCRWKVSELRNHITTENNRDHFIPFIAVTETWLNSSIRDAQIHIPGYISSRSDRNGRGGGVLLYSHESFSLSDVNRFEDGVCEVVFCRFNSNKLAVAVIY